MHAELQLDIHTELQLDMHAELQLDIHTELQLDMHAELQLDMHAELQLDIHTELQLDMHAEMQLDMHTKLQLDIHTELQLDMHTELQLDIHTELQLDMHAELQLDMHAELHLDIHTELQLSPFEEYSAVKYIYSGMRIVYRSLLSGLRFSQYCRTRAMATAAQVKPVEASIWKKLTETFQPVVLDVINESNKHNVPKGSETHFKVVVITDTFEKLPLIKRHRMINETLQDELQSGVHALSIVAKTPQQWEDSEGKVSPSPPCQGGNKL